MEIIAEVDLRETSQGKNGHKFLSVMKQINTLTADLRS